MDQAAIITQEPERGNFLYRFLFTGNFWLSLFSWGFTLYGLFWLLRLIMIANLTFANLYLKVDLGVRNYFVGVAYAKRDEVAEYFGYVKPIPPSPPLPPLTIDAIIRRETAKWKNVPVKLVYAMMHVESGGDKDAVSDKGAIGLLQVMEENAPKCGLTVNELRDPEKNLMCGIWLLSKEIEGAKGDIQLAIARYNFGGGKRYHALVKKVGTTEWLKLAPHLPPETQAYVPKVLNAWGRQSDA